MALVVESDKTLDPIKDWEKYATSKKWKKSLAQNSDHMELTTGTYNGMKTWFPRFLKSTVDDEHPHGMTPDELIEEALGDPEAVKDRLFFAFGFCKKFIQSQDENSLHNNAVTGIYGNVRGFYSHNLPYKINVKTPSYRPRTVVTTDAITPLTKVSINAEGKKIVDIDRDIFQEFLRVLPLRDKVVETGLISSGMDTGDICKVTVGMIRDQKDHDRIFFNNFRSKTYGILNTFWSKEATTFARQYITEERESAEDSEPLLVNSVKEQRKIFYTIHGRAWQPSDPLPAPTPLTPRNIARNFRTAARNIRIPLKKGVQSPFRPKKQRKLFSDGCDKAGIGENKRKIFMGKGDNSNTVYTGQARHELEVYYELVEPYVTIQKDLSIEHLTEEIRAEVTQKVTADFDEKLKVRDMQIQKQSQDLEVFHTKEKESGRVTMDAKTHKTLMKILKDNNLI